MEIDGNCWKLIENMETNKDGMAWKLMKMEKGWKSDRRRWNVIEID